MQKANKGILENEYYMIHNKITKRDQNHVIPVKVDLRRGTPRLSKMHKFSYSPAPFKKVKHVQWGLFSPEEIVYVQALFLNPFINF
jgi:hypothetical protein